MSPRLHHVALRVADLARASAFYEGLLGLPRHSEHRGPDGAPRAVWLQLGGGAVLMLELQLRGAGPGTGSAHVLALAVEELSAWVERLADAGVTVDDRTGYTLFVRDPDGHRVGLSVFQTPPPA